MIHVIHVIHVMDCDERNNDHGFPYHDHNTCNISEDSCEDHSDIESPGTTCLSRDEAKPKWYEKDCLSYFNFSSELMQRQPKLDENIAGHCKTCNKKRSGQIKGVSNWINHLKVFTTSES